MTNLKVTLKLKEGLGSILSDNPLDGVLAKLYFEKLKKEGRFDGDFFMRLPFLEMHPDGFYHISNPIYKVEGINNYAFYKSFDADTYEAITGKMLPSTARKLGSGQFKVHTPSYELSYVKELVFYCRGERETIRELLCDLRYIGKKSAHGAGKVHSVTIEETDEDRSVVSDGELMRPVPYTSSALEKTEGNYAVRLMPVTHPYWDRGREVYAAIPGTSGKKVYRENILTQNPPKALAMVFGFEKNYVQAKKHRKYTRIESNPKKHKCKMCGRVQESGYVDPLNVLIKENTNDFYKYIQPRSPFLCDYCQYNYSHYMKKMQGKLDRRYGDMSNILLFSDRFEEKYFNADDKNELYDILADPPKEPFAVILKELAGTSAANGTYAFLPAVDTGLVCVTYGTENHFVQPDRVFACIETAETIFAYAKKKKMNLSEDVLFNRSGSENYANWYSSKLASDERLSSMMRSWFSAYDRSARFVAKIILKRYRKEQKKGA